MQISALKDEVLEGALAFAWDQWSQMGLLGEPRRITRTAIDPEALLLFSLDVARRDPRLFDEILDWLSVNERLVSVQRVRNLAVGPEDRALVDAAISWAGRRGPQRGSSRRPTDQGALTPLFPRLATPLRKLDEAFEAHGFARAPAERSGKSRPPDVTAPANFAFRLRYLLGVGARAEAMRCLLTIYAPRVSAQVVARSAVYSKRNVQEALNSLRAAQVIVMITVGGEQSYRAERETWGPLFGFGEDDWPAHRDWPQLLRALLRILRWLEHVEGQDLSDYMRASQARDLLEQVADDLLFAGVPVERMPSGGGDDAWSSFVATTRNAVSALGVQQPT